MVLSLTDSDPERRPDAAEALLHPWIRIANAERVEVALELEEISLTSIPIISPDAHAMSHVLMERKYGLHRPNVGAQPYFRRVMGDSVRNEDETKTEMERSVGLGIGFSPKKQYMRYNTTTPNSQESPISNLPPSSAFPMPRSVGRAKNPFGLMRELRGLDPVVSQSAGGGGAGRAGLNSGVKPEMHAADDPLEDGEGS